MIGWEPKIKRRGCQVVQYGFDSVPGFDEALQLARGNLQKLS
jgi:hypothetical protein